MKHIFKGIMVVLLTCFIIINCEQEIQREQPKEYEDTFKFDYSLIKDKSKNFTPQIGKSGGTLSLPLYSEPVSFNPITNVDVNFNIYEGLVKIDGVSGNPKPELAVRWEVSADSLSWTFFIREGVLWSDNTPFTAYDVQFTFNDLIYNKSIYPNVSQKLFDIDGEKMIVSAIDSMSVRFKLPKPYAPFIYLMSQEILPEHICKKLVKKNIFTSALTITASTDLIVGTGPFVFASYSPLSNITLYKNPLYWKRDKEGKALPYLDTLLYLVVTDVDNALQNFKKGEIDYFAADGKDFTDLKEDSTNFKIHHLGPAFCSNFLVLNQNTSTDEQFGLPYLPKAKQNWFRNKMFRKALAYAINKEKIINEILDERGFSQWSPVNPALEDLYNPNIEKYHFDLEKASNILTNEGFKDRNNDGYLEDPSGNIIEFSLSVNNGNIFRQKTAELIVSDLKHLGMRVHLLVKDDKVLYKDITQPPYEWDVAILGINEGVEPQLGMDIWHSSGTLHFWFPNQNKPSTLWESRIDSLFIAAALTNSREERKSYYHEWQRIVADELPLIFTVRNERILCVSKRVKNCNPSIYGGLLNNIETLFVQ